MLTFKPINDAEMSLFLKQRRDDNREEFVLCVAVCLLALVIGVIAASWSSHVDRQVDNYAKQIGGGL